MSQFRLLTEYERKSLNLIIYLLESCIEMWRFEGISLKSGEFGALLPWKILVMIPNHIFQVEIWQRNCKISPPNLICPTAPRQQLQQSVQRHEDHSNVRKTSQMDCWSCPTNFNNFTFHCAFFQWFLHTEGFAGCASNLNRSPLLPSSCQHQLLKN